MYASFFTVKQHPSVCLSVYKKRIKTDRQTDRISHMPLFIKKKVRKTFFPLFFFGYLPENIYFCSRKSVN